MKREFWGSVLVYFIFYGLILAACLITQSAWPLLSLVFTPDIEVEQKEDIEENK